MRPEAARMRKWMLLGAGAALLSCLLGAHAGGAGAGMALWLWLGEGRKEPAFYGYPRKRRGHFSRLFFAWACFCLSVSVFCLAEKALFPFFTGWEHGLFSADAVVFSVWLCSLTLGLSIHKGKRLWLGALMLLLSLMLYFL